jgi:hypothetical protein
MDFTVQSKLECVWRCRLVPATAARCATCLWTFGSVNLPQAFYLRRTTQIHKRTSTCIMPRRRFNQMYPVGQQYKTNSLGFMIVSRALCIFTLCPATFGRESAGDGEICSGRLATDPTYVKNSEEVASVTIN